MEDAVTVVVEARRARVGRSVVRNCIAEVGSGNYKQKKRRATGRVRGSACHLLWGESDHRCTAA
jgi:hypothetical protein